MTKYIYTATGKKLRAIHYTAPRNIHVAKGDEYEDIEQNCMSADSTDYLVDGNIIYKNNCFSKILFDGGFIGTNSGTGPTRPIRPVGISDGQYHQQLESWMQLDMNVYGYKFYNKDHLGNIREIVDKNGQICQKTDYYPYGTPILFDPFTINDTSHPYKYNGKELDMMHGLNTYDYGARQYNSALPLWDRVDPLAEKYYHVSPYAYCANDPVNYVDLDGRDGMISIFGNSITIGANIYLYGNGATKPVLKQMQKDINNVWKKNYSIEHNGKTFIVSFDINLFLYGGEEKSNPLIIPDSWNPFSRNNYIKVIKNNIRSEVSGSDEGLWRSSGRYGMPLSKDDPAPHEVGHILGLSDQYNDNNGINKGWEQNIMGDSRKGKVDNRNIRDILNRVWQEYDKWLIENKTGEFKYEINP
ncbi:RHS repeat-associated core domain-containing protein [uncultured Prevotella sp.]|uniref:RHS repeat domain-containing protein n=1 Tax=uncultured Prevotella sp. TaxID=159272 RepID=UPI0025FC18F1|nr:RHS repeat-associated core domain-containing protein [uncultured Prevotella sp.]